MPCSGRTCTFLLESIVYIYLLAISSAEIYASIQYTSQNTTDCSTDSMDLSLFMWLRVDGICSALAVGSCAIVSMMQLSLCPTMFYDYKHTYTFFGLINLFLPVWTIVGGVLFFSYMPHCGPSPLNALVYVTVISHALYFFFVVDKVDKRNLHITRQNFQQQNQRTIEGIERNMANDFHVVTVPAHSVFFE